jgi:hypothetical protein
MELVQCHFNEIMKRFPNFELSYETISHKKVSTSYDICYVIPHGKKCYIWFTFLGDEDVCFMLDLNRDKKIVKASKMNIEFDNTFAMGTILYGSYLEEENGKNFFTIEEIYYYKGIHLKNVEMNKKMDLVLDFMKTTKKTGPLMFALPVFWKYKNVEEIELSSVIPDNISEIVSYPIHHLQYRSLNETKPHLNVFINKKLNFANVVVQEPKKQRQQNFETIDFVCDYFKPQYRQPTVFQVCADIQFDIYHLFAYGNNKKPVYYNIALVPNYKTSVFMNGLFRNIKENKNLDYIEESEDEDEFQDMSEDKYVDLEKILLMECVFNMKFKKWLPVRVVESFSRIVNLIQLQKTFVENDNALQKNRQYHNNNRDKFGKNRHPQRYTKTY